jgi:hypothetical protein
LITEKVVKLSASKLLLLLALGLVLVGVSGCQTDDPENISVRPWDAPKGWEGGMPIDNQQHN